MRKRLVASLLLVGSALVVGNARADEPLTPPVELRHDLKIDIPVTAGLAADYFTDTLAGAVIGTVVGGGVPLLFRRPVEGHSTNARLLDRLRPMASPVRGGSVVGVSGLF